MLLYLDPVQNRPNLKLLNGCGTVPVSGLFFFTYKPTYPKSMEVTTKYFKLNSANFAAEILENLRQTSSMPITQNSTQDISANSLSASEYSTAMSTCKSSVGEASVTVRPVGLKKNCCVMLAKMKPEAEEAASCKVLDTQEARKKMELASVRYSFVEREELMIQDRSHVVGSGSAASLPSEQEEAVLRNPSAQMNYQAGFSGFCAKVGAVIPDYVWVGTCSVSVHIHSKISMCLYPGFVK